MKRNGTVKATPRTVKRFETLYRIPAYLVLGFGDGGMVHVVEDDDVNTDDLRVAIELSGGMKVLLDGQPRLILGPDGIEVQYLIDVAL